MCDLFWKMLDDTTTAILWPIVWDYPSEPVPEETLAHSYLS